MSEEEVKEVYSIMSNEDLINLIKEKNETLTKNGVEIEDLQTENTKLKEHLKRTHQIMTEMNEEIAKLKQEKEELIKKPKVIVQNKLKEITEEYHKLDKKNLNTANIITHQYNSMRTVLEEVLEKLGDDK